MGYNEEEPKEAMTAKGRIPLLKKITRRLLYVGLLPIISLAIISVLLSFISYAGSNALFERTLLNQKRVEVQRFIQDSIELLQVRVALSYTIRVEPGDQKFLIEGIMRSDENLLQMYWIETLTQKEIDSGLSAIERDGREFSGSLATTVAKKDKQVLVCERSDIGEEIFCDASTRANWSNKEAYTHAAQGEVYVGTVQWEKDRPTVTIASDVRNANQERIGVIAGKLDLSGLQGLFDQASFGGVGSVFLTDQSALVMAHSSGTEFRQRNVESTLREVAARDAIILDGAFIEGKSFTSGATIVLENQQWFLVTEWPLFVSLYPPQGAFVDVVTLAFQFFSVGLLLVLIVRFIALRFSASIVNPIRAVQEGALRIGSGEFDQQVEVHTNDEIEDLGHALNDMAVDLARLQQVRIAETRAQALATAVAREQQFEEEKDTLISTASHQFRTPVTALNWNIDLLKTMKLPPDAADLLVGLKEHTRNLATIAGDLLNSTAFGAGYRATPDAKAVDMNGIVTEVLERFATQITEKKIQMTTQLPEQPIMLRGSFAALRISLEQVVTNAIEYSDEGGPISVTLGVTETGAVAVQIIDEGIGIPKDQQHMLFNPFFRAKNAIEKKNVGTGLGLFIANNIITGHGGEITVVSVVGKGTTVTVELPASGIVATTSRPPVTS